MNVEILDLYDGKFWAVAGFAVVLKLKEQDCDKILRERSVKSLLCLDFE